MRTTRIDEDEVFSIYAPEVMRPCGFAREKSEA